MYKISISGVKILLQNQHIWCKNVQNPALGSALIPKHWQQVCLVGNTSLTKSCITTRDNRHSLSKEISPLYICIHIYVCYCMLYTSVLNRKELKRRKLRNEKVEAKAGEEEKLEIEKEKKKQEKKKKEKVEKKE